MADYPTEETATEAQEEGWCLTETGSNGGSSRTEETVVDWSLRVMAILLLFLFLSFFKEPHIGKHKLHGAEITFNHSLK